MSIILPTQSAGVKEGHAPFQYQGETHQTYYKVFGDLHNHIRTPVVVLHGGPGLSHDYMLPLADLVHQSYPVVLYDQIGNARSTHLPQKQPKFWTIDLFLDEFDSLLRHLGIQDRYHIVGHSWGGMMAAELVVRRQPKGLKRLVISDSPSAVALWGQSLGELLEKFPQWVKDAVKAGFENPKEQWKALLEVYAVHGCRAKPFPKDLEYSLLQIYAEDADRTVDQAPILNGWTVEERMQQIKVPTLVINGKYDIAQDYVTRAYSDNIPDSKWITFEESSHTPFWEQREKYMQIVGEFLAA